MTPKPEDFLLQAWKRQADTGVRLLEALLERSTRIHEIQLEAATQAHADLEATRKALIAASSLPEILNVQTQWAQANAQKCLAYWRTICEAAVPLPEAFKGADLDVSKDALLGMVDSAYKQWLDTAQSFYKPLEKVAA
jgi:phasin family protein